MNDGRAGKRKTHYRLVAPLVVLAAALVLVLVHPAGGVPASAPPPANATLPITPAAPWAVPTTRDSASAAPNGEAASPSLIGGHDKPLGVWQYAGRDATIQLQIREWDGTSAPAVVYVVTARPQLTAIYKGQVSVRTGATLYLSVVEEYGTRLPGGYRWCGKLSGTVTTGADSDEEDLDLMPLCTDGIDRSIIHRSGNGSPVAAIPSTLTDSGTHALHLGSTAG